MNSKVNNSAKEESKDEVDFIPTAKKEIIATSKSYNPLKKGFLMRNSHNNVNNNNNTNNNNNIENTTKNAPKTEAATKKTSVYGDCELQTTVKSHISALEKFHLFHFPLRKKSDPLISSEKLVFPATTPSIKEHRPRLIKSSSLARLFGNTYSTKKLDESRAPTPSPLKKSQSVSEKFSNKSSECDTFDTDINNEQNENSLNSLSDSASNLNSLESMNSASHEKHNMRAIRTITRGIGKLLRRNCDSADISAPDPEYKVFYLGNVLTGWAKGDACIEKPLATLWRNYTQNSKPEVLMRLKVCPSGLKATTRQHGLTEYWAHRITFCVAPRTYPKVFCWIYRHEGRKLKHELRCHAVICSKEVQSQDIANVLKHNLSIALREFKRDKICKQNARLSLANAADDNPSMPRRKILLSTGANNYRPPLERSKSAPKLMAIEEILGEEEEEEDEDCDDQQKAKNQEDNKKRMEIRPCCKEDYLYPSVTLGRRRCRRGHSIRRSRLVRNNILTQKSYPPTKHSAILSATSASVENFQTEAKKKSIFTESIDEMSKSLDCDLDTSTSKSQDLTALSQKSLESDEDFESFLLYNNYDSKDPLAGDLMSYFDMKLQTPSNSIITTTTMSMSDLLDDEMSLSNQRTSLSLDNLVDYQSDNELEEEDRPEHRSHDEDDDIYFNQDSLLATLRRQSKTRNDETTNQHFIHANKKVDLYEQTEPNDFIYKRTNRNVYDDDLTTNSSSSPSSLCMSEKTICINLDSDEGSISSGCETSSTMTTNNEESPINTILPRRGSVLDRVRSFEQLNESQVNKEPIGERVMPINNSKYFTRCVTFPTANGSGSSSSSFMLSSSESKGNSGTLTRSETNSNQRQSVKIDHDSDSDELSDESGYVEFQDLSLKSVFA